MNRIKTDSGLIFSDDDLKSIQVSFLSFKLNHPELVFDEERLRPKPFAFLTHIANGMEANAHIRYKKSRFTEAGIRVFFSRKFSDFFRRHIYGFLRPYLLQQQEFNQMAANLAQSVIEMQENLAKTNRPEPIEILRSQIAPQSSIDSRTRLSEARVTP